MLATDGEKLTLGGKTPALYCETICDRGGGMWKGNATRGATSASTLQSILRGSNRGKDMRVEKLSLRQVALVIPVVAFFNWVVLQFALVPGMGPEERTSMYPSWLSTPYPYVVSFVFMCAAIWFAHFYRGRYATHGLKLSVFALAWAALCGLAVILAIRLTWHI